MGAARKAVQNTNAKGSVGVLMGFCFFVRDIRRVGVQMDVTFAVVIVLMRVDFEGFS
jgi:hypothetical protein